MNVVKAFCMFACVIITLQTLEAQSYAGVAPAHWGYVGRGTGAVPYTFDYEQWWEDAWADYMAEYRAWEIGYIQDWNENMQKGIKRLNTQPLKPGVTPINGTLLLNEVDVSVPSRLGNHMQVNRYYNSKIWYRDTTHDSLDYTWHLGMGWQIQYGRLWPLTDSGRIYESSNGLRYYFRLEPDSEYVSTDGTFMRLYGNTIKTGDGTQLVFNQQYDRNSTLCRYLSKIIDRNGNIAELFYSDLKLDSIMTSTNEKLTFHYGWYSQNPDYFLESIVYKTFNNQTDSIVYYYDTLVATDSSPFGSYSDTTVLLESVVYPNGESVYYDYNQYYELTAIHNSSGGLTKFEYKTDTFYIPVAAAFPPDTSLEFKQQLTRGITKVKSYDQWTAPDTNVTTHERIFTETQSNQAVSNADSVRIIYPEGSKYISFFRASYAPVGGESEAVQWSWKNGMLDSAKTYDKNGTFVQKKWSYPKYITADSITVLAWEKIYNGAKTYYTYYHDFDDYGNARLIHEYGDMADNIDDHWIHRKFTCSDTNYCTFWLNQKATGYKTYDGESITKCYSQAGIDTIQIIRKWLPSDSTETWIYDPAGTIMGDSTYLSLESDFEDTMAIVVARVREYSTSEVLKCSVAVYIGPDLPTGGQRTDEDFAGKNIYTDPDTRYMTHLISEQFISSDSTGSDTLSKVDYFYDDTSSIVRHYTSSPPVQWDTLLIMPHKIRGNLTRIEHWKDGSDYTKSELRYDDVGNAVMAIAHPETSRAETTFTYYDPPSDPDTFNYAYPWRTVHHLSTSVCSLFSRTEYDLHTGLPIRTFDANGDSTVFEYDNMNRLTKTYLPNESSVSHKITYIDTSSPEAIIDSIKLDTRWMVNKSFYDGFGRLIQTKNFDFDNSRTVTQSISYNANRSQDSVSNPYQLSGTSYAYSTPNWSTLDITRYQNDGLGRITKVYHPDAESIRVKHYANTDTTYDENGNKTILIYNAFGSIDTVINALNDTICYEYDRLGQLKIVKDAEGKETKYYYDKQGRLAAMNCPDAKSPYSEGTDSVDVAYEYDGVGNLTRKKEAKGWTEFIYDDINRLVKVKYSTNEGSSWSIKDTLTYDTYYTYGSYPNNAKGRLSRQVTVGVDSTTCYYDDRGRLYSKRIGIAGLTGIKDVRYDYSKTSLCTLLVLASSSDTVRYQYNRLTQITGIPGLVHSIKYNPSHQIVKTVFPHNVIDTLDYNNRFRPTYIKAYKTGPAGDNYLKLAYTYEKNGNVASIVDSLDNTMTQSFKYTALNQLDTVLAYDASVAQRFTYDKAGNRTSKNGNNYQYYGATNRLKVDHRTYTHDYDDHGNIIRHRDTTTSSTIDSFAYNWHDRLIDYAKGSEKVEFAYNASGLRVKKHYYCKEGEKGSGASGSYFLDPFDDMGMKSTGADTLYNKGRDIERIYVKDSTNYLTLTVENRYLFSGNSRMKLFITIDIDTIPNSGRLTLPEDTLTRVMPDCAWEYCIYVDDTGYGLYRQDGTKISMPFGMLVQRVTGDTGTVKVKIAKSLINGPQSIRYTISTFDPNVTSNPDSLWQGGSVACDVFPGTPETFGGEINGYGEITSSTKSATKEYTIYYVYNGINPIVEYSPNGSILARYVYAGGLHIAKIAGADTNWYHCDALGSPRKMTNELGTATWTATYYPFGEMTAGSNNTHGFTGKEFDSEIGLNYFCQRYYDPQIGRFTSLDPQDSPASSPYAYCANNPLRFTDPTGMAMQMPIPYSEGSEDVWDATSWRGGFGSWLGSLTSYINANLSSFYDPAYLSLGAAKRLLEYESDMLDFNAALRELSEIITAQGEPCPLGDR
ncbi:MAG: RHS repeat-associated core domain-containing protein, partial [candidate division WOR-3 bacterium]